MALAGSGEERMTERTGLSGLIWLMFVLPVAVWGLAACKPETEDRKVNRFIAELVERAEDRDLEGIMTRLAPDYADFEGRDKEATEALASEYLRDRRGIAIRLLATRIEGHDPSGRALVRAEVLISSGAAEALRRFVSFAGECYRFDFTIEKTRPGGWLITYAEWEDLPSGDLLPESVEILKKLFSGK